MARLTPEPKKKVIAAQMKATKLEKDSAKKLEQPKDIPSWSPSKPMSKIVAYVEKRSSEMMDYRRGLGVEQKWLEADEEYIPHQLDFGTTRKRFETDQDTGLRSRLVPVGDATQQWRSAASAPTLLAKIQIAVSLIFDNEPEGKLTPLQKKYTATTEIAYSLWKRNWSVTGAKEKYKLFIFNLFKYGWSVQRTYPRLVTYPKKVLTHIDTEDPENNKYKETNLEWFNDVDRQVLDPFRTWVDELSVPYDPFSTNEVYYELDYSYDQFMIEFGAYPNSQFVPQNSVYTRNDIAGKTNRQQVGRPATNTENKTRKDIVTVGFFESRLKDLFVIYVPAHKIVVYQCPLPNDDGMLSLTHTPYIIRNAKLPYGVSLWEILRQNKQLYDKMKNMTMDQLVLSIMKFGMYSGTSTALGDGMMDIVPGQARQITTSTGNAKDAVSWMQIPGPGEEAWKGLEALEAMMESESGITPTLEGEITGKTLGEILNAKESALKRLKTPVENICWAIEQDAYVALSWMKQIYTIPTVQNFTSIQDMQDYEKEAMITHEEVFGDTDKDGTLKGPVMATYLPELSLHIEDKNGELVKGKESQFFQIGSAKGKIPVSKLRWQGIFKVIPRSVIDSSEELVKASKMELFNIIVPLLQNPPELVAKPLKEIMEANEEDYHDWLPDTFVQYLDGTTPTQAPGGVPAAPGTAIPGGVGLPPQIPFGLQKGSTLQANSGTAPAEGSNTVVPPGQITQPNTSTGGTQLKPGAKGGPFSVGI